MTWVNKSVLGAVGLLLASGAAGKTAAKTPVTSYLAKVQSQQCSELIASGAWRQVRGRVLLATPYDNAKNAKQRGQRLDDSILREVQQYICDNFVIGEGVCDTFNAQTMRSTLQQHPEFGIQLANVETEGLYDTDGKAGLCNEWGVLKVQVKVDADTDDITQTSDLRAKGLRASVAQAVDFTAPSAREQIETGESIRDELSRAGVSLEQNVSQANERRRITIRNADFNSSYTREEKTCIGQREIWERKVVRIAQASDLQPALACHYAVQAKTEADAKLSFILTASEKAFGYVRESLLLSAVVEVSGRGAHLQYDTAKFIDLAHALGGKMEYNDDLARSLSQVEAIPIVRQAGQKIAQWLQEIPAALNEYQGFYGAKAVAGYRQHAEKIAALIDPLKERGLSISDGRSQIEFVTAAQVRAYVSQFKYRGSPINDQYKFLKVSDFRPLEDVLALLKFAVELELSRRLGGTWEEYLAEIGASADQPFLQTTVVYKNFARGLQVWGRLNERSRLASEYAATTGELSYPLKANQITADGKIATWRWQEISRDLREDINDLAHSEHVYPLSIQHQLREREGEWQVLFAMELIYAPEYPVSLR